MRNKKDWKKKKKKTTDRSGVFGDIGKEAKSNLSFALTKLTTCTKHFCCCCLKQFELFFLFLSPET